MKTVIVSILLAIVLAGCGGHSPKKLGPDDTSVHLIGGDYKLQVVIYKGHPLYCIVYHHGGGRYNSYGGPSCDFVQFHHYFGYGLAN